MHYNRMVRFSKIIAFLIVCFLLVAECIEEKRHRVKRKVLFSKNSKLFFRLNGKDNIIPWVQLFAQGWALRINYDLPDTLHRRHRFFKRDVYSEIENISGAGLGGYSCILNYICEQIRIISTARSCEMLCQIGRIISSSSGNEAEFFKSIVSRCDYYYDLCTQNNTIT